MTPNQICQLLEDDYLQFLPVEGRLLANRVEGDAIVYLFAYAENLMEVFFSLPDLTLMGSCRLEDSKALDAFRDNGLLTTLMEQAAINSKFSKKED